MDVLAGVIAGAVAITGAALLPRTRAILKETFTHPTRDAVLFTEGNKVEVKPVDKPTVSQFPG